MTQLEIEDLVLKCFRCIQHGINITLIGQKPKGFPRGELLCINFSGEKVYSYDPQKVINYFAKQTYRIQK